MTDGLSNTAMIGELRVGPQLDGHPGTWAMGFAGASMDGHAKNYNPTPNDKMGRSSPPCDDGSDELQTSPVPRPDVPRGGQMGMGVNCGGGIQHWRPDPEPAPRRRQRRLRRRQRQIHQNTITNQVWFDNPRPARTARSSAPTSFCSDRLARRRNDSPNTADLPGAPPPSPGSVMDGVDVKKSSISP